MRDPCTRMPTARGDMEYCIEGQLYLFVDRTSTVTMRASQLRVRGVTLSGHPLYWSRCTYREIGLMCKETDLLLIKESDLWPIPCLMCERMTYKEISWLKDHVHIACDNCGSRIQFHSSAFDEVVESLRQRHHG